MLLPVLLYQGFDDVISRRYNKIESFVRGREPFLKSQPVPTGDRVVTYKIPPGWSNIPSSSPNFIGPQQYGEPLTHEERYGWNPDEAREEYSFGGKDGTPRFRGYFG